MSKDFSQAGAGLKIMEMKHNMNKDKNYEGELPFKKR